MTGAQISYGEDGYTLTPQGQARKLGVSGAEPATQPGTRPQVEPEAGA